jgi:hypothetical protein
MEEMEKKSGSAVDSLTVKSILALLSTERMIELFDVLEMTIPERPDSIQKKIDALETKYFDLVWLARRNPQQDAGMDCYQRVVKQYPEELLKLQDPDNGDWQHGFNSGMLACVRLLRAYALPYKHGERAQRGSDPIPIPVESFPPPGNIIPGPVPNPMTTLPAYVPHIVSDSHPGIPTLMISPLGFTFAPTGPPPGRIGVPPATLAGFAPNFNMAEMLRSQMATPADPEDDEEIYTDTDEWVSSEDGYPVFTRASEIRDAEEEFPFLDT